MTDIPNRYSSIFNNGKQSEFVDAIKKFAYRVQSEGTGRLQVFVSVYEVDRLKSVIVQYGARLLSEHYEDRIGLTVAKIVEP